MMAASFLSETKSLPTQVRAYVNADTQEESRHEKFQYHKKHNSAEAGDASSLGITTGSGTAQLFRFPWISNQPDTAWWLLGA